MRQFLEEIAKKLKISDFEKTDDEALKNLIKESIDKNLSLEKNLFNLYEEISCNSEFNLRIIALVNLLIQKIYEEKYKKLNNFLKFALDEFAKLLPIENISYMEKHARWNYLLLKVASGKIKYEDFKIKKFPINNSVSGEAFKLKKYIYIPNTQLDERFNKSLSTLPIKSLLAVPLREKDRIIGVLNFSHAIENAFPENCIYFLIFLSNLFSSLINLFNFYQEKANFNAKLLKEVEKKTIELHKANIKLYKTSITDPLTGLYNRKYFFQRLEEEFSRFIRYGNSFCLILIDLDRLKYINDKYGHLEGDRCLKLLGKILINFSRKEDICARIGGDEFACLIIGSNLEGATSFTERVKEELKKLYKKERLTLSAGVGCISKGEHFKFYKNHKEFFKKVDLALLKAKKTKDQVKTIEKD